ncbi:TetR/AcrR family transcriptional regulator [Glycomyces terrestris]|uniref:TetR/AcrR family transcriptional regulator n=1 Tax=Glycomyces terrestris TaxID=2493553 RepID=A0A426V4V7_9ACTN|nr:TetR/AcrR family transcriptional regulator [Glycomyces terrestris]RRS01860.1 TetR/AcrR family transcriptional regulator [Glycomyces terrestris]
MDLPLVPLGKPRGERADAKRNRLRLLATARRMMAEGGPESVTMDALAERAGLGKGTVFRRFGTRAGIFRALLEEEAVRFQELVLAGPPPLGPGAGPAERLVAYGRVRIGFLVDNLEVARAAMERDSRLPAVQVDMTFAHVRMLLRQADLGVRDPDSLAMQLAAALEGPLLLYVSSGRDAEAPGSEAGLRLADAWQDLVERLFRSGPK